MPCTTLCSILFRDALSHETCECECHVRERRADSIDDKKTTENLREIANNLDLISAGINKINAEIAELNRKLAEVEGERDALRELLSEALEYQRPDHMAVDCKCWVCRAEKLDSPAK